MKKVEINLVDGNSLTLWNVVEVTMDRCGDFTVELEKDQGHSRTITISSCLIKDYTVEISDQN